MPISMRVGKRTYKTHTSAAKALRKKRPGITNPYAYINKVQSTIRKRRAAKRKRKSKR